MNAIAEALGQVGLPEPVESLARRDWDAVIVGGGHNGLTCAAYLARAGQSVLVLERAERLGGACTLERPFEDDRFVISPCAYVVGLLDARVISDLELRRRGVEVYVADPQLWVPFEDGSSFAQWMDDARTQASLEALGVSARDIDGYGATRSCSTTSGGGCARGRATPGWATRPRAPRSRRCSAATSR